MLPAISETDQVFTSTLNVVRSCNPMILDDDVPFEIQLANATLSCAIKIYDEFAHP